MTRSLVNFSGSNLNWTVLMEWLLSDGVQRIWAGPVGQTLTYAGETYSGSAGFIGIDKVTETGDGADARTVVTVRLMDGDDVSDGLEDDETGTQVNIIFAALDQYGEIAEWLETVHYIDEVRLREDISQDGSGAQTITSHIEVELVTPAVILDRAYTVNMTYTEQLSVDAADHSLEFVGDPDLDKLSVGGVNNPMLQYWQAMTGQNPYGFFY